MQYSIIKLLKQYMFNSILSLNFLHMYLHGLHLNVNAGS